jgi:hypothetical protein
MFKRFRNIPVSVPALMALCLGAFLLGLGCDGQDKNNYSDFAKKTAGDGDTKESGGGKSKEKRIRRPSYVPPKDPESHRLDMLDNERTAYTVLRKFSVGQLAFTQHINPLPVDLDGDKVGEYAYLLELMGVSYLRTPSGLGRAPIRKSWQLFKASDERGETLFNKTARKDAGFVERDGEEYLVDAGGVVYWVGSDGIAERAGYYFMFFLPGEKTAVNAGALVPAGNPALADLNERYYAGIAWPKKAGVTGRRVFYVRKFEEVWARWNIEEKYDAKVTIPDPWCALDRLGDDPKNLKADVAHVDSGLKAMDEGSWKIFGERKKIKREFEWKWPKEREIEDYKQDGGPDRPWMTGEEKKKKKKKSDD